MTSVGRLLALSLVVLAVQACRQDMHNQPKYRPLRGSELFDDKRSARPLVEGTVARGSLREDALYYTGKTADGRFISEIPVEVTPQLLERGRTEFNVFCSPCHGRTGRGDGMVQRGYKKPSSYHVDRLRQMPIGYFYDVMTIGFGAMPDYAGQIVPADRWAIAAYVRTLQLSQYAPAADVPADKHDELEASVGAHSAVPAAEHHP
jgi:mono/diheme cytochrome c family protein